MGNVQVLRRVTQGMRPIIDDGFPVLLKTLIQRCWAQQAEARPTIYEVVTELCSPAMMEDMVRHDHEDDEGRVTKNGPIQSSPNAGNSPIRNSRNVVSRNMMSESFRDWSSRE